MFSIDVFICPCAIRMDNDRLDCLVCPLQNIIKISIINSQTGKIYPSKNRSSSLVTERLHIGQIHVGVCSFNIKNVAASKQAVCWQYRDLHGKSILVIEIGSFNVNVSGPGTIST